MSIQEVRVGLKEGLDLKGQAVAQEIEQALGIKVSSGIRTATIYRFEEISEEQAEFFSQRVLTDPITQTSTVNQPFFDRENYQILEIGYKSGVMNPVEASLLKASADLRINPVAVSSSQEFAFGKDLPKEQIEQIGKHLVSQVEEIVYERPKTLILGSEPGPVKAVNVCQLSDEELVNLSNTRRLFLNLKEMQVIRNYYQRLDREPTDVEIETLAQTWSEHNGHKTFKAKILTEDGQEKMPFIKRIRETSERYFDKVGVVTAFSDNAGGIRFYEGQAIIAKGETHNSPVAVEPYGGSLTKNGGVYRDIAGCGQGGINLVSLMINCFASPETSWEEVPTGCLHPRYLLLQNSQGERDYGNRMGIPTQATSIHFHPDFIGKPTSLGVVIGTIPEDRSQKGVPRAGDLIVSVGGKTGRDGIHGATFSSGEMTAQTKTVDATAVQIGNAIEEKRMFDALIACRDNNLIRAITDCGGGGYSSAIGEIGEPVGVEVHLEKVPLKYSGLSPWEIWLSESQERMIVALDPQNWYEFYKICNLFNTPTTVIGNFTGDKQLTLKYDQEVVGEMSMDFLHHGLPQREMKIKYTPYPKDSKIPEVPSDWIGVYKQVLSHLNVCSKERMLRQYDQNVQGTTVLEPFTGVYKDAPNDASVIAPSFGKPYGIVTAFGLNPILNRINPYWGSIWAVTEAVSNFTAVGGNIEEAALIDNFIWPFPDQESLASLDGSVDALCLMMEILEVPCVSGKDSLSSTYKGEGKVIKIPPVLNITVFGRIPDVEKTVSVDIKSIGSTLFLVGSLDVKNLGGSVYFDTQGILNTHLPKVWTGQLPRILKAVREAIQTGKVKSCHDIGEGGLARTIFEMCVGGNLGVDIDLSEIGASRPDFALFNETAGCFVVEVENEEEGKELFGEVPYLVLGKTIKAKEIVVNEGEENLFRADLDKLKQAWKKSMEEIFA